MGCEREDIRAALELLLTAKQYAYILGCRGRSRQQWLRILVNDGMRYRMADSVMRARYAEAAREYLEVYTDEADNLHEVDELEPPDRLV